MTKNLSYYAVIVTLVLFLSGCVLLTEESHTSIEETKSSTDQQLVLSVPFVPVKPASTAHQGEVLQSMSRMRHYDWNGVIQPMLTKMLKAPGVSSGSILLVDSINNWTNGLLNTEEATETLRDELAKNGKFMLVSLQKLSITKRKLGLLPQDSFGSRSKAIGIARNVGAQYLLYSNATGNVNSPSLQMQLMQVQSGEIIWSGKGVVTQV